MPRKFLKNTQVTEHSLPEKQQKKTVTRKSLLIISLFVLILFVAAGTGGYVLYTNQVLDGNAKNGSEEVTAILNRVGKIYELPQNEQVTLATVTDVTKLEQNGFFAKAQNGDKVLIYKENKLAILYRPGTNKIIATGPVTENDEVPVVPIASPSASREIRVALYNGTTTVGLTKRAEGQLLALSSIKVEVTERENASSSAYLESIVVDLTGKNREVATQLASGVKGTVQALPQGETKPTDAEILIILGKSYVTSEEAVNE